GTLAEAGEDEQPAILGDLLGEGLAPEMQTCELDHGSVVALEQREKSHLVSLEERGDDGMVARRFGSSGQRSMVEEHPGLRDPRGSKTGARQTFPAFAKQTKGLAHWRGTRRPRRLVGGLEISWATRVRVYEASQSVRFRPSFLMRLRSVLG